MKLIQKQIIYAGLENPRSVKEINLEIMGLKNAIAQVNELISRYEQAIVLSELNEDLNGVDADNRTAG